MKTNLKTRRNFEIFWLLFSLNLIVYVSMATTCERIQAKLHLLANSFMNIEAENVLLVY